VVVVVGFVKVGAGVVLVCVMLTRSMHPVFARVVIIVRVLVDYAVYI
jgi:hypothetical protein